MDELVPRHLKLPWRHIQPQSRPVQSCIAPSPQVLECLIQYPIAQRNNQSAFLGQRDEVAGWYGHTTVVGSAQQNFPAYECAGLMHLRLHHQVQLVTIDRLGQFTAHVHTFLDLTTQRA